MRGDGTRGRLFFMIISPGARFTRLSRLSGLILAAPFTPFVSQLIELVAHILFLFVDGRMHFRPER